MNSTDNGASYRLFTPVELAILVKAYRERNKWSQEQLAEISGLNVRTVQRVEQGQLPASLDTKRALARAFSSNDIDVFNKPVKFPTEEELKAEKEKFERENIVLKAILLSSGREWFSTQSSRRSDRKMRKAS